MTAGANLLADMRTQMDKGKHLCTVTEHSCWDNERQPHGAGQVVDRGTLRERQCEAWIAPIARTFLCFSPLCADSQSGSRSSLVEPKARLIGILAGFQSGPCLSQLTTFPTAVIRNVDAINGRRRHCSGFWPASELRYNRYKRQTASLLIPRILPVS